MSRDVKRYTMCMNSAASHSSEDVKFDWIKSGESVVRASDFDFEINKLTAELNAAKEARDALHAEVDAYEAQCKSYGEAYKSIAAELSKAKEELKTCEVRTLERAAREIQRGYVNPAVFDIGRHYAYGFAKIIRELATSKPSDSDLTTK